MTGVEQPIGGAVLYVSSTVDDEAALAFDEWCNTIHHFDTMRIPGFLSLRRFRLIDGTTEGGGPEYRLLTLYQVEDAAAADMTTPAYEAHTASYTPPPPGVTDHIIFERTVYDRRISGGSTQTVGAAMVSLGGEDGAWLDHAEASLPALGGVLSTTRLQGDAGAVLLVDVADVDTGLAVLDGLSGIDHRGQRRWAHLFEQVFPETGVLARDRMLLGAVDTTGLDATQ